MIRQLATSLGVIWLSACSAQTASPLNEALGASAGTNEAQIAAQEATAEQGAQAQDSRNELIGAVAGGLLGGIVTSVLRPTDGLSVAETVPPDFEPWPPPRPTDFRDLREVFRDQTRFRHLSDVQSYLENEFEGAGIRDFGYFSAPGGFAIVTPLEELDLGGKPKPSSIAQQQNSTSNNWFHSWLTRLLECPTGYYGAVVVFVTTDPRGPDMTETVTPDDIRNWTIGGTRGLPDSVKDETFSSRYVYADVYDFRQVEGQAPQLLQVNVFDTDEQLKDLGINDTN